MLRPLERLIDKVRQWTTAHFVDIYTVRGFRVLVQNTRPDIETTAVLARLDEALALIEQYQPWRFTHLKRDLAEFHVVRYPCRGAYFPDRRACMTELTFLARPEFTAATVASSIIHEGIHARVKEMTERLGTRGQYEDRAREERLCRKAELQFGLALPRALGAPVIERALATLASSDAEVAPTIDWRVARARQELDDLAVAALPDGVKQQLIAERRAIIDAYEKGAG